MHADAAPHGAGTTSFFRPVVSDRRVAAMLGLGFSSGIPFLLVYVTQSAWLSEAKVPLAVLGLLSELTLAYKFKFLWAPFLDRYDAPVFSRLLGRRRGWLVLSQVAVAAALGGVAFGDPADWLAWTIVFSLALGFAGATQDVVIDGWRITVAPGQQPLMSSWAEIGWRVGNLAAGAGALYLADAFGWRAAYLCMAALMAPGMAAALLAPEPEADKAGRRGAAAGVRAEGAGAGRGDPGVGPAGGDLAGVGQAGIGRVGGGGAERAVPAAAHPGFVATVAAPIRELMGRLGPLAVPVLLMVAGFRMPGYVSSAMAMPLFKSLHYSNADIATVTKLFGFGVALLGTFTASVVVPRIGMMASLLAGTVFGSASHLALALLAAHGTHGADGFWFFALAVSVDNFAYAFASIVLITYMSSLASSEHAASQFALLTSLCALPGSLLAGSSGFAIERLGFEWFFVATSLIGVPVAVLCWWVWRLDVRSRASRGAPGDARGAALTS